MSLTPFSTCRPNSNCSALEGVLQPTQGWEPPAHSQHHGPLWNITRGFQNDQQVFQCSCHLQPLSGIPSVPKHGSRLKIVEKWPYQICACCATDPVAQVTLEKVTYKLILGAQAWACFFSALHITTCAEDYAGRWRLPLTPLQPWGRCDWLAV